LEKGISTGFAGFKNGASFCNPLKKKKHKQNGYGIRSRNEED
jgi:hypothetical protein